MNHFSFQSLQDKHHEHVIFRGVWGSFAYGTNTPESDRDTIGIFILPKDRYLALEGTPAQISDATNDNRFYSLRNYCELAANANPNILDSLFLPHDCVLHSSLYWDMLQQYRNIFVSKLAGRTYCEYALSQIKKARGCNKRVHNPQPLEAPEAKNFCRIIPFRAGGMPGRPINLNDACISLTRCHVAALENSSELFRLYDYGADAGGVFRNGTLVCESIPKADEESRFIGLLVFNKNAFEKAKSEHRQYWEWRNKRNESRWRNQESGESDYDAKNLMHTFRLLYSGLHIIRFGEPLVRFSGEILQELMNIRNGLCLYDELLNKVAMLTSELERLRLCSTLPECADHAAIDRLLLDITNQWEKDHAR